jgi:hypothetical protein
MAFETKATHITFLRLILREASATENQEVLTALKKLYKDVQAIASADGAVIPSFEDALRENEK